MEDIKIPTHIAIQMDGNRRWGRKNKGNELEGHRRGAIVLKEIVKHCKNIGVKVVTVYALSIENLKRSEEELNTHFGLHKKYIKKWILDSDEFVKTKTRFQVLGRKELLPKDEQELIKKAEEKTKNFSEFVFNVCLCYNGQDEIVDAVKEIINNKIQSKDITRDTIKQHLYTRNIAPPDIMIKTGMNPEKRISAFLLYDLAYTELFFTSTLWPDFSAQELNSIIEEFKNRERRFGK